MMRAAAQTFGRHIGFLTAVLTIAFLAQPAATFAQGWSGARSRSVQGIIKDQSGRPVSRAIVELQNTRTLNIRSYLTHQDGRYHFEDLYSNVDYTLRVRYHGAFGPEKLLSRFDSRTRATLDLEAPGGK